MNLDDERAEYDDPTRPGRRPQVRSACGWLNAPTALELSFEER